MPPAGAMPPAGETSLAGETSPGALRFRPVVPAGPAVGGIWLLPAVGAAADDPRR